MKGVYKLQRWYADYYRETIDLYMKHVGEGGGGNISFENSSHFPIIAVF